MKYFFVAFILSLCVAGLHAKKQHLTIRQHMASLNIDQFCPHAQKECDWWCRYFKYEKGVCEKTRNIECWCYLNEPKLRKVVKIKDGKPSVSLEEKPRKFKIVKKKLHSVGPEGFRMETKRYSKTFNTKSFIDDTDILYPKFQGLGHLGESRE
ncbi:uncharacterized protein LOC127729951 [Mytilus californianus]|uniref:uncharacterized protein LOC127729951 n=1 Tax=Mytilus californianus TaxID=6549 RepID=UPI0022486312|nr:uncharacterized protein LOC127729951 [Mytilus californianus]XP_052093897.1 uncharacterized protein LOC127729951 [Mytilus californianus]XP_052093898.1 uncharacterized protein LOC127729951 [Mytilus californianus]